MGLNKEFTLDVSNNIRESIVKGMNIWSDEFKEKLVKHDLETFLDIIGINSYEYTHTFPDIILKIISYGTKKIVENEDWEVVHK